MPSLSMKQLVSYSDEFARFFANSEAIEVLDLWAVNLAGPWPEESLSVASTEEKAWVLLWNSELREFLLLDFSQASGKWTPSFAPDRKKALFLLYEGVKNWQHFFPLIVQAHDAAHRKGEDQDRQFLERLLVDALLKVGGVDELRGNLVRQANVSAEI